MLNNANLIAKYLSQEDGIVDHDDPLIIRPLPDMNKLNGSLDASIDLKLGCWFSELRQSRSSLFDVYDGLMDGKSDSYLIKKHYVKFGEKIYLHPSNILLGVTLEWIRMPKNIGGYVTSRSSWGRRGLIIATATGVHPHFTGCLTLELYNAGQIPIALYPGMAVCQLFMHSVDMGERLKVKDSKLEKKSCFSGRRQPSLGDIKIDATTRKLMKPRY